MPDEPIRVPVAVFAYKRAECLERLIAVLQQVSAPEIVFYCDAPRVPADAQAVERTRQLAHDATLVSPKRVVEWPANLGGPRSIPAGLADIFERYPATIVLEEDCIPDPSFFGFCDVLLERYAHDRRVFNISGDNFLRGRVPIRHDYYFSKYFHTWGWATWRDRWALQPTSTKRWAGLDERERRLVINYHDPIEHECFAAVFDDIASGKRDHYDYRFFLACLLESGLAVLPRVNLVSNIGFGAEASNCRDPDVWMAGLPTESLDHRALAHPSAIVRNAEADAHSFDEVFGGRQMRESRRLRKRVRRLLRRLKPRFTR